MGNHSLSAQFGGLDSGVRLVGDRFGTKRIFYSGALPLHVWLSSLREAQSLNQLILFRVLQGVGGGMLTPVGTAMLFRAFLRMNGPRHQPCWSYRSR